MESNKCSQTPATTRNSNRAMNVSNDGKQVSQKNNLKCIYSNVDSLMNKRNELLHMIGKDNPDIICLTEILPKNTRYKVEVPELQLEGYDVFTNINEVTLHRGVVIYTKKNIGAVPSNINANFSESVWCEVPLQKDDRLCVGCVYRSPNSTQANNDKLNESLIKLSRNKSHILVAGDFNYPEIEWKEGISPQDPNNKAARFMEATRDAFLTQHVLDPTHFRNNQVPNVLDLVFTNEDNMISIIEHLAPLGKSHHQVLKFNYKCYTVAKTCVEKKFCFIKGDYNMMQLLLNKQNWDVMNEMSGKKSWNHLEAILQEGIQKTIPKRKTNVTHRKSKWMNERALLKLHEKRKHYNTYIRTRQGSDYAAYARARNQVKWECKNARREFERKIADESKKNPKAFYSYARSKMKTKDDVADLEDTAGYTATKDIDKSKVLNDFFCSVFTQENKDEIPVFDKRQYKEELSEFIITREMVEKKLLSLNPNKSPGPDGFHPLFLRELAHQLSDPLKIVFQKCLLEGHVPQSWKDAHVIPIFKKGKKSVPGNYRPVSLTSIICKLMESLIRDKVVEHMTNNNLLTDYQHGFVNGRSCSTNLLNVLDSWTEALDNGIPVDAIYLDFAKAFDTVPHLRLLNKLKGYGVTDQVLNWIKNFLQGRRQCVKVNGAKSEWSDVTSGIPQGSVLGPCLFVIFINDLPEVVKSLVQMFADDTKVYTEIHSNEDHAKLQHDIDSLYNWSDKWKLKFNAGKCKVLHLGRNNPSFGYSMKQNDQRVTLGQTELEKDLGVNIDPQLNFSQHIESQVNKANKILGMIRRSYEFLDGETLKKLFIALVRPHLEFSNVAWSPKLLKDKRLIEAVQRRATKMIPALEDCSYEERLKILDMPSLMYRRARGDMIEVYKYTHGLYTVNDSLLTRDDDNTRRGHGYKLRKRHCKTATRKNFFSYRVVNSWNSLPHVVVSAPTMNSFKSRLDKVWKKYRYMQVEELSPCEKITNKTLLDNIISDDNEDQLTGDRA